MELMNKCMARTVTRINEAKLNGAGEHPTTTPNLNETEFDVKLPRSGQGDISKVTVDESRKENENENQNEKLKACRNNELVVMGVRLAAIATLHPLEYAKVLIQLGHEPLPAQISTTVFGQTVKTWPNLMKYIGHIRRVDGFYGCYRGLTPRLMGFMVSLIGGKEIVERIGLLANKDVDVNQECYEQFANTLKRDIALTTFGLILSHPFHVISLRMMAQFVGHETTYKSIFGSILEIYRNDGLIGFFAGLVPKLVCDVSCVILTSSVTYFINKYYVQDKLFRQYNGGILQYIFASMLYPLQVISTCMAVSNSGLAAAKPPRMMEYNNWIECLMDLGSRGEHKRGASLFWRSVPRSSLEIAEK